MILKKRIVPLMNLKISPKVKFVLILLGTILLSGIIEFIFNIPAISVGDYEENLSPYIEMSSDRIVCDATFNNEKYIGKLRITGEFYNDTDYSIEVSTRNDFDVKETEVLGDTIYRGIDAAYTNLNMKVERILVIIYGLEQEDVEDIAIIISNEASINMYRYILVAFSIFLLFLVGFYKKLVVENIKYLFVLVAFGFGLIIIVMVGPRSVTWDEQIHYANIYQLASGDNVEWSNAAWRNYQNNVPGVNTKEELDTLKQLLNDDGESLHHLKENTVDYTEVAMRGYFPMAVVYKIMNAFGLSYTSVYMMGRISNLIFFVFVIYLSLHFAKERKILIFSLSVLPTVLFQGSTYTYDGVVYSCLVLGFVLMMNEFQDSQKLNMLRIGTAILLIIIGCFSKAVFIPLILFVFALPNRKFANIRQAYLFKFGICLVFVLMMSTFVLPALANTVNGNLEVGDARVKDTSMVGQIISMIKHPFASVKLFLSSIFSFDNFRNLGMEATDNYLFTNLMFLNFASAGILDDKWSLLLIPLLVLLFFVSSEKRTVFSPLNKIWCALLVFAAVILVWTAMYLTFTPVGSEYIDGVQARYYFPLLLPISLITYTGKIESKMEIEKYNRLIIFINIILLFISIYKLLLTNNCM